jgi:succinate dehydrogenase / fumarate reductase iron-sulfur subunit
MQLQLKIFRFNPETDTEPSFKTYSIEAQDSDRILDCLNKIKWEQDGSLSYRMSCAHGVCGSDAMRINGKCALACQKLVKDCEGSEITIEPLPTFTVLKDLIVDLTPFFERVEWIRPYLIAGDPPEKERIQLPADRAKMAESIRCILCACCMGVCPVENANERFLGPAPLVQAFRRIFDSRDLEKAQRLEQVDYENGAPACENYFECTRACPKEIPVTKEINTIKRAIKAEK